MISTTLIYILAVVVALYLLIFFGLMRIKFFNKARQEYLSYYRKPIDEVVRGSAMKAFFVWRAINIIIYIILIAILIGGFFTWQYFSLSKEAPINNISIIYTSENYAWGEQIKRIEILKDGKTSYFNKIGDKKEESSKSLTGEELKELSDFIISKKFFDLPNDLTNPQCADAPTEYLEITVNQKTHRAGGGCVMNETFQSIVERLEMKKETIIEFPHPEEWGNLELKSQKNNTYFFNSQNEKIEGVIYHQPSKQVAFIEKGEKRKTKIGDQEVFQETLKIIDQNKNTKIIYAIPVERVEWWSGIYEESINFSPGGEYIGLLETGYEYSNPALISVASGSDIFKNHNIWFRDFYKNVSWSSDSRVLAVKSEINEFAGEGISGVFVSDYGNPENLNLIFSIPEEQYFQGVHIADARFINNEELSFTVDGGAGTRIYFYNAKTKESRDNWQTYRKNEEYGFEISYPEKYIDSFFASGKTPKIIATTSKDNIVGGCFYAPGDRVRINNIDFCASASEDAGMGHLFKTYFYLTSRNNNYYIVQFEISQPLSCANYVGSLAEKECEGFFRNYREIVEKPMENILSTFRFL